MWVRKPIDLAAVGGLRLLGESRYELAFRFPMALYLDETCGTVESTFTLVYKSTGLPESGAEFKRIYVCSEYRDREHSEGDLHFFWCVVTPTTCRRCSCSETCKRRGRCVQVHVHIIKSMLGGHRRSLHVWSETKVKNCIDPSRQRSIIFMQLSVTN